MTQAFNEFHNVLLLAFSDYKHEWRMSGCYVLALASVLAPMLLLFGLKFGIITSMFEKLAKDPRNREIRMVGTVHHGPEWFAEMAQTSGVDFIIPRTRAISANMTLKVSGSRSFSVDLIPSAPGDPLLIDHTPHPTGLQTVVLSSAIARKLRVNPGDLIDGSVTRRIKGKFERKHLPLTVLAVAPPAAFNRDVAFVSLELLLATEDFRDGREVTALGWTGNPPLDTKTRTFPSFRLFAVTLEDVIPLGNKLIDAGLEVRTRAADIALVQSMDRNLSIIYWVIALVGFTGYSLSLVASTRANVDRKRRELSILRLVGFQTNSIVWFPVLQALFTGALGTLLAIMLFFGVQTGINHLFGSYVAEGGAICYLYLIHFVGALVVTLATVMMASAFGGYQVSKIEPSDGLREV